MGDLSHGVFPALEPSEILTRPFLDLQRAGRIPAPSMDFDALHRLEAEVLVAAGRWDHDTDSGADRHRRALPQWVSSSRTTTICSRA